MNIVKSNGEEVLVDNADLHDFELVLNNINVASAALHKPGSRIKHSDGTEYEVMKNGSWKRVKPEES